MGFDWAGRYEERNTPWDLGRPHPELERRLAEGTLAPPRRGARALVPGCGRGYDAARLADAGWNVVALDTVEALEPLLARAFAGRDARFVLGDALEYEDDQDEGPSFELVWDHTFFCALDPADRPRYGALALRSLAPGGRFASLVFPADKPAELGGPPFGFTEHDVAAALGPEFRRLETGGLRERVSRRRWAEDFIMFERA